MCLEKKEEKKKKEKKVFFFLKESFCNLGLKLEQQSLSELNIKSIH